MAGHRTTTRRAGRLIVLALVACGAGSAWPASPAAAADPVTFTVKVNSVQLQVGGPPRPLVVTVGNTSGQTRGYARLQITVPAGLGLTAKTGDPACSGSGTLFSCAAPVAAGASWTVIVSLTPPKVANLPAGGQRSAAGSVAVLGGPTRAFTVTLTAGAPTQPGTPDPGHVPSVQGSVRAASGMALAGATVALQDPAGHRYETVANAAGQFTFASTPSSPIGSGVLTLAAAMSGYRTATRTDVVAAAGVPVTGVVFVLAASAPSPTASQAASAVAAPPAFSAGPSLVTEDSTPAAAPPTGSGLPWAPLLFGTVLLLIGAAAIGYLLWRRVHDADGRPALVATAGQARPAGEVRRWWPGPPTADPGRSDEPVTMRLTRADDTPTARLPHPATGPDRAHPGLAAPPGAAAPPG